MTTETLKAIAASLGIDAAERAILDAEKGLGARAVAKLWQTFERLLDASPVTFVGASS